MNRYLYKNYCKSIDDHEMIGIINHALFLAQNAGGRVVFSTTLKDNFPNNELLKAESIAGLDDGFFKRLLKGSNVLAGVEIAYVVAKDLSSHLINDKDVVILIYCPLVKLLELEKKIFAHDLIYLAPHVQHHKSEDNSWETIWDGQVTVMDA